MLCLMVKLKVLHQQQCKMSCIKQTTKELARLVWTEALDLPLHTVVDRQHGLIGTQSDYQFIFSSVEV